MATIHITEAELAQDVSSVLDHVQSGTEVVIERNAIPVAVLRAVVPKRRLLSEIVSSLPEHSTAAVDADFAADIEAVIDRHREPLRAPDVNRS